MQLPAERNDQFRRTFTGGQVVLTRAVAALPHETIAALVTRVRTFDAFIEANDPFGERDTGAIEYERECYFWKIDAHSGPAGLVLTLMLASEVKNPFGRSGMVPWSII